MGGWLCLQSRVVLQILVAAEDHVIDMCQYMHLDPASVIDWLHQSLGIAPLCCL